MASSSTMPFRDDTTPAPIATDPLARFRALNAALDAERGFFGDRAPLRLAAVTLMTVPGDAVQLVARVRATDAELAPHYGWTSGVHESLRLVLAATLVRTGESVASFVAGSERVAAAMKEAGIGYGILESVASFVAGSERVPAWMKQAGIWWAGVHGILLRRVVGREPSPAHVDRMWGIHAIMKEHHWFLTGPQHLTICAMLIGKPGSERKIADHVEAIYRRLADAPKTWGGDTLQMAAGVLALASLAPDEAADRFLAVASALRAAGVKVTGDEYVEVAVLTFVPRRAEVIAADVAALRSRVSEELSWYESSMATHLAVSLACVRLVADERDGRVGALADAKLLLDMQSIVAMQAAAAAV